MSSSEPWSESLVKTTVDEHLFDELEELDGGPARSRLERLRDLCRQEVTTKDELKALKAAISALKKERKLSADERDLFDEVKEELAEIADDLKLVKSRRGRFTLAAQDWVQGLYVPLRAEARFADVMVGPHAESEILMVVGEVASNEDLESLRELVSKHESPWPIDFQVAARPR